MTDAAVALPAEAAAWVERLGLEPLEHEGGLFRQMHLDAHSSAIYYLLAAPDFSALHSLASVEVYHWYAGAPLRLLLLHPDGRGEERLLGPDADAGQLPQLVVPPGVMQGSSPATLGAHAGNSSRADGDLVGEVAADAGTGAGDEPKPSASWSLIGTTMSPPFDWNGFKLGERAPLQAAYPEFADRIAELTR